MDKLVRTCTETYLQQFNKRVTQLRVPISGSMDLTHKCNLRCVHCYLDPQNTKRTSHQQEMNTEEIKGILDEVTAAGCLYILFTGGEPFARADFADIYQYAKSKGLLITIFTNGTLITEKILDLFDDLPPRAIEISLYGATAGTYEKITGVKGSYNRCISGIEMLLEQGLNLRLKTILMTSNRHEFFETQQMAKDYGVPFRFDAALFPRFNGDRLPLELRVLPEEVIDKEFSEQNRRDEWKRFYDHFRDFPTSDAMYQCGAGLTYFHIDAYGNLQPCLMSTKVQVSLKEKRFLDVWNGQIRSIREQKMSSEHVCANCSKRILCGYCPAFFQLETNSYSGISEFMCSMGQLRYERLQSIPVRRGP